MHCTPATGGKDLMMKITAFQELRVQGKESCKCVPATYKIKIAVLTSDIYWVLIGERIRLRGRRKHAPDRRKSKKVASSPIMWLGKIS
jgi:hypothetical protein